MRASKLCFLAAVLAAIAGMLWGLDMAISENHAAAPAHAHLNLLGWVSLFLFGTFYRLHPQLDATKLALAQVWVWIIGTIIMAIGIGLISNGTTSAEPIAAVGSLIVLADMLLFAWLVFRSENAAASA
jgi:hypothetical protein